MKYYSSFKKKEILQYGRTWMNSQDIMLRERNGHRRTCSVRFHIEEARTRTNPWTQRAECCRQGLGPGEAGGR